MGTAYGVGLKRLMKSINWKLLLFLLLFLNVKLVVKVAAIFLLYIIQPNRNFGFRLHHSRIPLFYILMIGIAVIDFFLFKGYTTTNYTILFLLGISLWAICILATHQLKVFIDHNDPAIIYNTLACFFLINAAVSAAQFTRIIIETGALNPFLYQGQFQKYFINTGDYIKGVTLDTSTVNAAISAFGVIFFLSKKKPAMILVCMVSLLLTASNLVNLVLACSFVFIFLAASDKDQKSIIMICLMLMIIFIAKVSPQNSRYISDSLEKVLNKQDKAGKVAMHQYDVTKMPDSLLTPEQIKEKIARLYLDSIGPIVLREWQKRYASSSYYHFASNISEKPVIPEPDIHSAPFQSNNDTNEARQKLIDFAACCLPPYTESGMEERNGNIPGKLIGMDQTLQYFKYHPNRILTGAGIANYSSKLAFKATSLHIAGAYPLRYTYINPEFSSDHLNLYVHYFTRPAKYHSVINTPASVYDQVVSEYGLIGLLAFLIGYIGFFLKGIRKSAYTISLLIVLLGLFCMDYWFEQLSIVIIFELMFYLNQKETRNIQYEQ